jgi:hypothetical protein
MMRAPVVALALGLALALAPAARAQAPAPSPAPRAAWRQGAVHYGKWLTAGAAVAFTALAAHEHSYSRRQWNDLLTLCRSAMDACFLAADGRYVSSDAELLYERSLHYDRRANRRLLGAQASLLVTAALFILDLRGRDDGPDNIPFSPLRVTVEPTRDGAALVGLRLTF